MSAERVGARGPVQPGSCDGGCARRDATVDRREFLTAAAFASIALALSACGDGQIGGLTGLGAPLPGGPLTVRLADFAALATVGGVARVTTTGAPIAVYRSAAATFQAFVMNCPHAGTTVQIAATGYTCPNHGARFAKDGVWLSGQRSSALAALPVVYDAAAGTLTIDGVPTTGGGGDDDDDDDDDDGLRSALP
jgi:Rieske Fe-S protein